MSCHEVSTRFIKRARKQHQCEWCLETIPKGTSCVYRAYILDGDFTDHYMHDECDEASDDVAIACGEYTFTPGEFKRGSTEAR